MTDSQMTSAIEEIVEVAAALQHTVGNVYGVTVRRIEASEVAAFVIATAEPNPLYRDPAAGRRGPWGEVVAPPTYLATIRSGEQSRVDFGYGRHGVLGGSTLEILRPVRIGDVIAAVETVVSVEGKTGRGGAMLVIETATEYRNATDELVGRGRSTVIRRG